MALSLNDLKKGKANKNANSTSDPNRRMVRPWEDPSQKEDQTKSPPKPVANQEQTGSKPVADPDSKSVANQEQTGSKPVAESILSHLVGNERRLLSIVFEECRKEGNLSSPPLTREYLSKLLETSHGTVKSAILRLERKGFLKRLSCKVGRGGWLQFSLPKDTFQKLLLDETSSKLVANREQTGSELVAKPVAQPVASPPSSSSSYKDLDLRTTTTGAELPGDWNRIDFSVLTPIRFGRPQILQLVQAGLLTSDQVQESINAFAFDLEANSKGKEINGAALNYFMGILRKGPYAPPANYESPDVRQMRLYLEAKKREQQARADIEAQLETYEFDSWIANLSDEEKTALVPPTDFARLGSPGHNVHLKEFFRETVWPNRKTVIAKPGLNSQEQK